MTTIAKNTICLWYERDAEEAARFYARTFPDSSVGAVHRAPGDYPAGKQGDVLTVEFTVMGIPCLGLNGGPGIQHNEAFSFQVATEDQAETYTSPDRAAAKRAFDAMMTMKKIDIAVIEAAVRGEKPSA
ncbi:VOC family protein [Halomonas sp. MA07-2]|uniref:VOC family protein n=1 Tax=Halomonas sp. MA07-2 TaxID=3440841 RepID=UPI003EEB9919